VTSDDWQEWRQLRRDALEEAPHAFGSTLAEWSGAGDIEQRWRDRLDAASVNLIAELDGLAVGMVSLAAAEDQEAEVISMWVAPSARERGIGAALLQEAIALARVDGACCVTLDVTVGNEPAINLYTKAGFVDAGWATSPSDAKPERRMRLDLRRTATAQ